MVRTHTHARAEWRAVYDKRVDGLVGVEAGRVRDIGSERLSGVMTGTFCSVAGPTKLKASSLKAGKSLMFLPAPMC